MLPAGAGDAVQISVARIGGAQIKAQIARPAAGDGLRRIADRKTTRRIQRQRQPAVAEAVAHHHAFGRIIIIDHAVYGIEERITVEGATGGANGLRFAAHPRHAFAAGRMGGKPFRWFGTALALQPRLQRRLRAQRGQAVGGGIGIIAGGGQIAHPQAVRLAFLIAAVAQRGQPGDQPGPAPDQIRAGERPGHTRQYV